MFYLNLTTKSLTAEMSGAAATTNPTYSVDFRVLPGNLKVNNVGSLNGTTEVDLVPAPVADGTWHEVDTITIFNIDTAAVTVILELEDDASEYRLFKVAIPVGGTWQIIR